MFIKRLLVLVIMLFILLGCGKTVSSDDITYNADKDLIVVKNTKNKPFTGTIEHYDDEGLFLYELKVKKGKLLTNDLTLELKDLRSDDFDNYDSALELISDTTID